MVVLLWLTCGGVFSWKLTHLIDKLLDHHKTLEFNSIHSKFGFLISSKLPTKYGRVLGELGRKPISGKDSLTEDVRIGEDLNGLKVDDIFSFYQSFERSRGFATF